VDATTDLIAVIGITANIVRLTIECIPYWADLGAIAGLLLSAITRAV
jgi:hypothetical protein